MFSLGMFKRTGCLMYIKYVHIGWTLGECGHLLPTPRLPLCPSPPSFVLQGPELHGIHPQPP